ncbi:MAG: 1-acyl-sn-glycerol-3-phosphate acyltransferase [Bacteroidales bacterium]|nr:1-acyl-sn-glycerol-3-phosphate acyltransferase [Bacteroidales bacterium]
MSISSFLAKSILRIAGWQVEITVPDYPKCIICVAPHTSNWDFFWGKLAYASVGRKAGFLMKEAWFFFPLGYIFKAIGGIPVPRGRRGSLVEAIIEKFDSEERMALAITPEGTRKATTQWHSGIFRIALGAHVPIELGVLDYKTKRILITHIFEPLTDDIDDDMARLKAFYRPYSGKHPEKFTT